MERRGRRRVFGRRGLTWLVEGEPHPASTPVLVESSVLDWFLVAAYAFHLGADPCSPKFAATGLSSSSREWIDDVLVPVVQAIRASASAIYTFQSRCSSQIKPGCGGSAPAPRAEGFIVMFILSWKEREKVCAGDVCRRDGGWWRLTFRGARG